MTSRFRAEALRPASTDAAFLSDFLDFLNDWESFSDNKRHFLSESTAIGFRVTIANTLSLLKYLTERVGFKYLMTSRLSTDPVEHFFGIVRQSSGCNAHPSPDEFLITVNCLSFYNLAHSVDSANANPDMINALVTVHDRQGLKVTHKKIDDLISQGKLDEVESTIATMPEKLADHIDVTLEKSDSRLIYYTAGYVARKCVLKLACVQCKEVLLFEKAVAVAEQLPSQFTEQCDWGGLLYPSRQLYDFIAALENLFTECFSVSMLHTESISDILSLVKTNFLNSKAVGCPDHKDAVSTKLVSFYVLTRLHFLVKGMNRENASKRARAKHLKLSRTT